MQTLPAEFVEMAPSRAGKRNSTFSRCGCRATQKDRCGDFAEDCFRIHAEIQSNPPQHCAAPGQQPRDQAGKDQRGSGGNAYFCIPPGGFAPLSTRESGLLLQVLICMI